MHKPTDSIFLLLHLILILVDVVAGKKSGKKSSKKKFGAGFLSGNGLMILVVVVIAIAVAFLIFWYFKRDRANKMFKRGTEGIQKVFFKV